MPISEKIIRQVKACFRLSKDKSNKHEAMSALETARRIFARHNLSMADISGYSEEPQEINDQGWKFKHQEGARAKMKYDLFEKMMHQSVAKICGVERIYFQIKRDRRLWTLVFVGEEQDVSVACALLKLLNKAMRRAARDALGDEWSPLHNHFCIGFAQEVLERAERIEIDEMSADELSKFALVVQNKEMWLQTKIAEQHPNLVMKRQTPKRTSVDPIAFGLGAMNGKRVSLGRNQIPAR